MRDGLREALSRANERRGRLSRSPLANLDHSEALTSKCPDCHGNGYRARRLDGAETFMEAGELRSLPTLDARDRCATCDGRGRIATRRGLALLEDLIVLLEDPPQPEAEPAALRSFNVAAEETHRQRAAERAERERREAERDALRQHVKAAERAIATGTEVPAESRGVLSRLFGNKAGA